MSTTTTSAKMPQQQNNSSERSPLLQTGSANGHSQRQEEETVSFDPNGDPGNPREWTLKRKYFQTFQIFMLASICPMASSIFAPAIQVIADEFGVSRQLVIGGQTGFVCMLGAGPLFLVCCTVLLCWDGRGIWECVLMF